MIDTPEKKKYNIYGPNFHFSAMEHNAGQVYCIVLWRIFEAFLDENYELMWIFSLTLSRKPTEKLLLLNMWFSFVIGVFLLKFSLIILNYLTF